MNQKLNIRVFFLCYYTLFRLKQWRHSNLYDFMHLLTRTITRHTRYSLDKRGQSYFISWCQSIVCARLDADERQQLQGPSTRWQRCILPQKHIKTWHNSTEPQHLQTSHNKANRLKKGCKAPQRTLQKMQQNNTDTNKIPHHRNMKHVAASLHLILWSPKIHAADAN